MSLPILYSFRRCPYAMRARLAIWRAGITCELREVVLRDKPRSMIEYSPKGSVPVLVAADGAVIDESMEIIYWALSHHDPDGWLDPMSGTLADMQSLIAINDSEFKEHLDRYKYPNRFREVDANYHRAQGELFLEELDRRIQSNGKLFGPSLSLADVCVVPFVRQFANVDRDWFDSLNYEGLKIWLADLLASPLFESIMMKYTKWQEGDTLTVVPPMSPPGLR